MRDASLTFDPPAGSANTPAVSRRRRGWVSPDGQRSVVAGLLALTAHGVLLWVAGFLPQTSALSLAPLRPPEDSTTLVIPLEGFDEAGGSEVTQAETRATAASTTPAVDPSVAAEPPAEPVVAPEPEAPLDFSDLNGAFGSVTSAVVDPGSAVGAGATDAVARARGDGRGVGHGSGPGEGAGTGPPLPVSRAQAARPLNLTPNCPWPAAAQAAELYREQVRIRVVVDASGHAESATALSDPGFGFAAAAEACALAGTYSPARDDAGQPVRATTPAMVFTFSR